MIDHLMARVPPEQAAYLANLLTAAVFGLALVAIVLHILRRGPMRGLEALLP